MTTAALPKRIEIKTIATHMDGTTNPIMTAPTAATRTCTMTTRQQQRTPKMVAFVQTNLPQSLKALEE